MTASRSTTFLSLRARRRLSPLLAASTRPYFAMTLIFALRTRAIRRSAVCFLPFLATTTFLARSTLETLIRGACSLKVTVFAMTPRLVPMTCARQRMAVAFTQQRIAMMEAPAPLTLATTRLVAFIPQSLATIV
jgi:hypothetical protein